MRGAGRVNIILSAYGNTEKTFNCIGVIQVSLSQICRSNSNDCYLKFHQKFISSGHKT